MSCRSCLGFLLLTLIAAPASANEQMLELAAQSGCFICHTIQPVPDVEEPLGPPYVEISKRYSGDSDAASRLFDRVKFGTNGREQSWTGKVGMAFMPPNVNVQDADIRQLVDWIISFEAKPEPQLIRFESMVALATTSGCMACHTLDPKPKGTVELAPAFRNVAARYEGQPEVTESLLEAVRNGTLNRKKAWPDVNMRFMPANVALTREHAKDLVAWILSLQPSE